MYAVDPALVASRPYPARAYPTSPAVAPAAVPAAFDESFASGEQAHDALLGTAYDVGASSQRNGGADVRPDMAAARGTRPYTRGAFMGARPGAPMAAMPGAVPGHVAAMPVPVTAHMQHMPPYYVASVPLMAGRYPGQPDVRMAAPSAAMQQYQYQMMFQQQAAAQQAAAQQAASQQGQPSLESMPMPAAYHAPAPLLQAHMAAHAAHAAPGVQRGAMPAPGPDPAVRRAPSGRAVAGGDAGHGGSASGHEAAGHAASGDPRAARPAALTNGRQQPSQGRSHPAAHPVAYPATAGHSASPAPTDRPPLVPSAHGTQQPRVQKARPPPQQTQAPAVSSGVKIVDRRQPRKD